MWIGLSALSTCSFRAGLAQLLLYCYQPESVMCHLMLFVSNPKPQSCFLHKVMFEGLVCWGLVLYESHAAIKTADCAQDSLSIILSLQTTHCIQIPAHKTVPSVMVPCLTWPVIKYDDKGVPHRCFQLHDDFIWKLMKTKHRKVSIVIYEAHPGMYESPLCERH